MGRPRARAPVPVRMRQRTAIAGRALSHAVHVRVR